MDPKYYQLTSSTAAPGWLTYLSLNNIKLDFFIVEAASDRLRNSHQQEVRHDHHDFHRTQHAHHDAGPLSPGVNVINNRCFHFTFIFQTRF